MSPLSSKLQGFSLLPTKQKLVNLFKKFGFLLTSASFYSRWPDFPFFALLLMVHGTQLDHRYESF
ncbi:hypothetical protein ACMBCN_02465, partial [Candidatus Liberibacter asiaticus]|nr:hypothetical protein [Candidatus Liberibacter asiaticus]